MGEPKVRTACLCPHLYFIAFILSIPQTKQENSKQFSIRLKNSPKNAHLYQRISSTFFSPKCCTKSYFFLLFLANLELLRLLGAGGAAARLPGFYWRQTSSPSLWLTGDKPSTIWISSSELPQLSNAPCQSTEPAVITQISPGNSQS